jgi:hypothetical protein
MKLDIRRINAVAILLIIVSFCVLWVLIPYNVDDFWFKTGSYGLDGLKEFTVVFNNMIEHWLHDNGRLVNMLSPIFLTLTPKWLYAILASFMLWVIIRYTCKLTEAKSISMQQWLIIAGISFILPWSDSMFTVIYSLNYVFTSAMVLFVMYRALQMTELGFVCSKHYLAVTLIASYVVGWMHEGFSVPFIIGLAVYALTLGVKRLPKRVVWVGVLVAVGLLTLLASPALEERTTHTYNIIEFTKRNGETGWFWRLIIFNVLYYIYAFAFICSVCHKGIRAKMMADGRRQLAIHLMLLSAGTVGLCLFIKFYTGARCAFLSELLSLIGLVRLLNLWLQQKDFRFEPKITALLAVVVTGATLYINGSAAALQVRLNKELEEVIPLYLASDDGVIYYDVMPFNRNVITTRTSLRQLTNPWGITCFSMYYGPNKRELCIKPTSERSDKNETITQ